jgi:hypothetical protein
MKAGGYAANFGFTGHNVMMISALNDAPFVGPDI